MHVIWCIWFSFLGSLKYTSVNWYSMCTCVENMPLCLIGEYLIFIFVFQTKGTSSFGKRRNKTHTLCCRCGRSSYHIEKSKCAQCVYPSKKLGHYTWSVKAQRKKITGTGRTRFLKIVRRRFRNGFREGGKPAPCKTAAIT